MKKYRQRPRIGNMYVPICICCQDIMFGSDANELLMLDLCIKTGFKLIPRGSGREREQRGLSIESIPAWCECVVRVIPVAMGSTLHNCTTACIIGLMHALTNTAHVVPLAARKE